MNIENIKKFLLTLVINRNTFFKYTENEDKIYEINLNTDYNEIKNIYNGILKGEVFNYNFDVFIFRLKEFIVDMEFYNVFLIEYEIIFYLDKFINEERIIFTEEL